MWREAYPPTRLIATFFCIPLPILCRRIFVLREYEKLPLVSDVSDRLANMFSRFTITAALLAVIGLGASAGSYSYGKVVAFREQIAQAEAFCKARELTPTFATVTRVVDGDTIKLANGKTVRVLGPDTPEICHPDRKGNFDPACHDEPLGAEATAFTKKMVEGKEVVLIGDPIVGDEDVFARKLRYVYLKDENLGLALVRAGFAPMYEHFSKKAKLYADYRAAEDEAKAAKRGVWAK